jgi:hypothetical protein
MLNFNRRIILHPRLPSREPFAVLRGYKNRDGPLIHHQHDGPQWYRFIGLEHGGTGPPQGTGPPIKTGMIYFYFAKPVRHRNAKPESETEVKFTQEYLL